jgi:ATP-dependent helicase HrpA
MLSKRPHLRPLVSLPMKPEQPLPRKPKRDSTHVVLPKPGYTPGLPIHEHKAAILAAIQSNQTVIIAGETGCGKTTQLPQFCLEPCLGVGGRIAVTQPRRIAAIAMARRVALETHVALGDQVGYRVRFDEQAGPDTAIIFQTDGMLLTEIPHDPLLRNYQTIIIDEAHERNLNIDFLLGYLRKILPQRPDLKLIISSATIDTDEFSAAFGNAPVIKVSGRLYPVELWYRPLDQEAVESGTTSYIDAAVSLAEEIAGAGDDGDLLIFMPTEADIHETIATLRGRRLPHCTCLPLFGRLTRGEQERIFASSNARKIIVSTNIAETSLTVPGIRFVIDTGLARVNHYAPRLRTTRLPVEAISQAAADQRKGRCGRVADGVCIRLYDEKEYLSWPRFAKPEIQRSNLASVILRMAELNLGAMDDFPFIAAPEQSAVRDGYNQLTELGALDPAGHLTRLGANMAALPLDPPIARMVLAAEDAGCLREVGIIAAGLSIVDPRERPIDKKEEADAAHKKFAHTASDFLTLLKLWDAYQGEWEALKTQNALRRFCRSHFLSYTRMREWHDIHEQIRRSLESRHRHPVKPHATLKEAHPDAIHHSILAGLISNVAMKRVEKEGYAAPRSREVYLFPGSVLSKKQPPWIVCHEIVETSRVFARTAGPIDPRWIEELAPGLCRTNYGEPFFEPQSGAVKTRVSVSFYGLPVVNNRLVDFNRIDHARCREVFIREALVGLQLVTHRPFLAHNRDRQAQALSLEDKLRRRGVAAGDDALQEFYHLRIGDAASGYDLERMIRSRGNDRFLFMQESDVVVAQSAAASEEFPDSLQIGGMNYGLKYAFNPGAENDGVTIEIPAAEAPFVPQNLLGWLVEPLWPLKIVALLRTLPKELRKRFVPLPESAARLAAVLRYQHQPFSVALRDAIREIFGIEIESALLQDSGLPSHLQMRVALTDDEGRVVSAGRLLSNVSADAYFEWPGHLLPLVRTIEKRDISAWTIGEIPRSVLLTPQGEGFALQGFPGLVPNKQGSVDYLLFPTAQSADAAHYEGVTRLYELAMAEKFAWLEKDLKMSPAVKLSCKPLGGSDKVIMAVAASIRQYILAIDPVVPATKDSFDRSVALRQAQLRTITTEAIGLVERSLALWGDTRRLLDKQAGQTTKIYVDLRAQLGEDLRVLISMLHDPQLLYVRLRQLPRILAVFGLRIERAFADVGKHNQRMRELAPWVRKSATMVALRLEIAPPERPGIDQFIAMVDEYAIALFGHPNIKTLFPISEKRLEVQWQKIKELLPDEKSS